MTVTAADLLTQVNAGVADTALAKRCVSRAVDYVTQYQVDSDPDDLISVPTGIVDEAVLSCAEDIFVRSKSQNGVVLTNFDSGEDGSGVVVRIGRDPLASVYPILRRWYNPVSAV